MSILTRRRENGLCRFGQGEVEWYERASERTNERRNWCCDKMVEIMMRETGEMKFGQRPCVVRL